MTWHPVIISKPPLAQLRAVLPLTPFYSCQYPLVWDRKHQINVCRQLSLASLALLFLPCLFCVFDMYFMNFGTQDAAQSVASCSRKFWNFFLYCFILLQNRISCQPPVKWWELLLGVLRSQSTWKKIYKEAAAHWWAVFKSFPVFLRNMHSALETVCSSNTWTWQSIPLVLLIPESFQVLHRRHLGV